MAFDLDHPKLITRIEITDETTPDPQWEATVYFGDGDKDHADGCDAHALEEVVADFLQDRDVVRVDLTLWLTTGGQ